MQALRNLLWPSSPAILATDNFEAQAVTLAIFDLDNTLIGGDSDHLWGQFVCEQGLVDSEGFRPAQR